jgi:hypothetical protein
VDLSVLEKLLADLLAIQLVSVHEQATASSGVQCLQDPASILGGLRHD